MRLLFLAPLLLGLLACAADVHRLPDPTPATSPPITPSSVTRTASRPAAATAEPQPPTARAFVLAQVTIRPTPPPAATLLPTKEVRAYKPLDPSLPAPPTAVPTAVPHLKKDKNVTLFALLGNDVHTRKGGRTDSIVLAAVNTQARTVTFLSIPRDLYVVIPGWTMQRINLAYAHGAGDGRGGAELFKETVAYNFGLPVDHTVRVGFGGFKRIVDAVGGIEVVVNCPVDDWRLKAPELDAALESSWEPYELGYGIQEMDGELALWYARSRHSSSDFDRGRRQQKILRALWQKSAASPAILRRLPGIMRALWPAVEADLSLDEVLALAALVPQLDEYTVRHLLLPQEALRPWRVPGSGEAVQLLEWQTAEATLRSFVNEPALHTARSAPIRVAIQSSSYILYRQAAENLSWYGFEAVYEAAEEEQVEETTITYYGDSLKGAYADRLSWILRQETADILLQPRGTDQTVDYRVLLASDYNPCLDYVHSVQYAVNGEQ